MLNEYKNDNEHFTCQNVVEFGAACSTKFSSFSPVQTRYGTIIADWILEHDPFN